MSFLTDAIKSGASSITGAVSDKLGIDPATAQGFIDQALPGEQAAEEETAASTDQAPAETTDTQQEETAPTDQALQAEVAEEAPAPEGLMGKASAMLGGSQGMFDKAKGLIDQDGDGNPLNDITGMVGKLFSKT